MRLLPVLWPPCLLRWEAWAYSPPKRVVVAAYWAAWVDALPVLRERLPGHTEAYVAALCSEDCQHTRAADARAQLRSEGWEACPIWRALASLMAARPARLRMQATATGCMDW